MGTEKALTRYEQWEALSQIARNMKLTARRDEWGYEFVVGTKRYVDIVQASTAILAALDEIGFEIPACLREPPSDPVLSFSTRKSTSGQK